MRHIKIMSVKLIFQKIDKALRSWWFVHFYNGSCHFPSNLTTNGNNDTFHIDSTRESKDSSEANLKPLGSLFMCLGHSLLIQQSDELPLLTRPYYTNCLCAALLWITLYPPYKKKTGGKRKPQRKRESDSTNQNV